MSKEVLKSAFEAAKACDAWSLQLIKIQSKKDNVDYYCREINLDPEGRIKKFVDELSNISMTNSNSGCRGNCMGLCAEACTSSCTGCTSCTGGCSTSCSKSCASDCGGGCNGCSGGCSSGCTATCGSGCTTSLRY